MMTLPDISYNFGPAATAEEIAPRMEKLAAAGAKRIMLDAPQLLLTAQDKTYAAALEKALKENALQLFDVHAPHGAQDSFGFPAPEAWPCFYEKAFGALEAAAALGAKTVTFHCARTRRVGQMVDEYGVFEKAETAKALENVCRQLEIVLPRVEKLGLVIALENLFLPTSTASFLVSVLQKFSHPALGLNYDAGHALLLEKQPGKTSGDIAGWIRCGWDDDTVVFQEDALDLMLENVVTAHLHDNHGCEDEHRLPGQGIADWTKIIARFRQAPRLLSLQSEVSQKFYGSTPEIQPAFFHACGF
ncbi:MAG: sugar phosphate isomerase/epimerase [Lentisphaeria bacterium]|nr:sugar phosphate isomerase/epimerase [Lentisphaeria bacterium]